MNHVRNIDRISYLEYVSWLLQLYSNRFDLHSSLRTDQSYSLSLTYSLTHSHALRVSRSVCLKLALVLMQNNPRHCAHKRKFHVFAIPFYIYRHVCALCCVAALIGRCTKTARNGNCCKWVVIKTDNWTCGLHCKMQLKRFEHGRIGWYNCLDFIRFDIESIHQCENSIILPLNVLNTI